MQASGEQARSSISDTLGHFDALDKDVSESVKSAKQAKQHLSSCQQHIVLVKNSAQTAIDKLKENADQILSLYANFAHGMLEKAYLKIAELEDKQSSAEQEVKVSVEQRLCFCNVVTLDRLSNLGFTRERSTAFC